MIGSRGLPAPVEPPVLRTECSASGSPRVLAVTVCGMSRPALSRLVCAIPLTPIADTCRRALGRVRWRPRPSGSGSARALVFGCRLCRLTWALFSHNSNSHEVRHTIAFSFFGCSSENSILNYDKYRWGYIIGVGLSSWFQVTFAAAGCLFSHRFLNVHRLALRGYSPASLCPLRL